MGRERGTGEVAVGEPDQGAVAVGSSSASTPCHLQPAPRVGEEPEDRLRGAWVRPFVEDLFERLGESVHLVVSAGSDVPFTDGMEGDQPLRIGPRTGALMPAYCTSGGKAMLADLDWGDIEA